MSNLADVWSPDWEKRLRERIGARGFGRVADYFAAHPLASYAELANGLGDDVAPIQVTRLQLSEAKQEHALREAAKDVLVRVIRAELPDGWGCVPPGDDAEPDYLNASAFASWGAPMKWAGVHDDVIAAVGERLKDSATTGWLPRGADDPLITTMFDAAWPAAT
ncbi:MAG TPA: hypothetical protein VGL86_26700 [Polyangia bacterium]|jgi:hypothetical protein